MSISPLKNEGNAIHVCNIESSRRRGPSLPPIVGVLLSLQHRIRRPSLGSPLPGSFTPLCVSARDIESEMGWGYPSTSATTLPEWTHRQNKDFEDALAIYGPETTDRWERIASRVAGKTAADVRRHYESLVEDVNSIDSGAVPLPFYVRDWGDDLSEDLTTEFQLFRPREGGFGRGFVERGIEQERKKGVPWTEEEHRLFLMGLKKYGKGDWRSISRYSVVTRTPTQVASHAQKYFIRLNSGTKDKRRPSIHDIINRLDSELISHDTAFFTHSLSPISDQKVSCHFPTDHL